MYTKYNYTYKNTIFYLFIRLHLIKICLCCFLDTHLYSNNLSTIATISSLIISELFPACFSCNNNFYLSQSSLASDDKNIVFETPEAIIAGDFNSLIKDLSRSLLFPFSLILKFISFANS